jgi:hypothetical protein
MVRLRDHLTIAAVAVFLWIGFYLLGMPFDYFRKFTLSEQFIISVLTFFGILPFVTAVMVILMNRNYGTTGIWVAFYFSMLPASLDFIVCGVIQGEGFGTFTSHWYLTIAYFYVWIICPLVGITLQKLKHHQPA